MCAAFAGVGLAEYYDGGGVMEEIRQWLLSVTVCAFFLSLLRSFVPSGAAGEAAKFALGLVLLITLLAPLKRVEISDFSMELSSIPSALSKTQRELSQERENALRQSIEERTEEYIAAKGLRAEVEAELTDGVWLPCRAVLYGVRTDEMAAWLERELGITQQEWRERE